MNDEEFDPIRRIERPGFSRDLGVGQARGRAVLAKRRTDGEWGDGFVAAPEYMDELALAWLRMRDRADELSLGRSDGGPARPPASEVAAEHGGDD